MKKSSILGTLLMASTAAYAGNAISFDVMASMSACAVAVELRLLPRLTYRTGLFRLRLPALKSSTPTTTIISADIFQYAVQIAPAPAVQAPACNRQRRSPAALRLRRTISTATAPVRRLPLPHRSGLPRFPSRSPPLHRR